MICPRCKLDNLSGSTFCENCGTSLTEPYTQEEPVNLQEELKEKIDEMKTELQDALKLNPEEIKGHINDLRENLKLGRGNLKSRLMRLKDDLKGGNIEKMVKDNQKPIKDMFIGFLAWAILRFTTPYHPRIIVFLLSPLGLLVLLVLGFVYGIYEKEVVAKMKEIKRGEKNDPVSQ